MTAKEYLSQAYRVDCMINAKLEQVRSLRELLVKANSTLSDTPRSAAPNIHRMENIIADIVDLENEINSGIHKLVCLKRDIMDIIKGVENPEQRAMLELRYLCFMSWEQIASELHYSDGYIYQMHNRILKKLNDKLRVLKVSRQV